MTQFEAEHHDLAPAAPRTSALAVTSLVFSLICCVPGLGALGALLGVGGVIGISRSGGRVRGMGLAVTGVVLGLIFTLLWIFLFVGINWGARLYSGYGSIFEAVEAGDRQALSTWLSPSTDSALTDQDIADFREAYQASRGAFVGIGDRPMALYRDFQAVGPQFQAVQGGQVTVGGMASIPLPAEFDSSKGLVVFQIDQGATAPSGMPSVSNVVVVGADNSLIWLLDPGAQGGAGGPGGGGDGAGGEPDDAGG